MGERRETTITTRVSKRLRRRAEIIAAEQGTTVSTLTAKALERDLEECVRDALLQLQNSSDQS